MRYRPLSRALGLSGDEDPDLLELVEQAVEANLPESDDLDWKGSLDSELAKPFEFEKDIAAMANHRGGMIVYGVSEGSDGTLTRMSAYDSDNASSQMQRMSSKAWQGVSPPVRVKVHDLTHAEPRCLVVEVWQSEQKPHFVPTNKHQQFMAPIRSGTHTKWLNESQLEAMYRARFQSQDQMSAALRSMVEHALSSRDTMTLTWFVAVARPLFPEHGRTVSKDDASALLEGVSQVSQQLAPGVKVDHVIHYPDYPIRDANARNPVVGLRRWNVTYPNADTDWEPQEKRQMSASIHHDGSVMLSAVIAERGNEVNQLRLEGAVADFMSLVFASASATPNTSFDFRAQIVGPIGGNVSDPFVPIEQTIIADDLADLVRFGSVTYALATDCLNQIGIQGPATLRSRPKPPEAPEAG